MTMLSLNKVLLGYIDSLRSPRDETIRFRVITLFFGLPVAIGLIAFFFGRVPDTYTDAITGISVVSSLMCAVETLLFQMRTALRGQFERDEQSFLTAEDLKLIDGLFSQILWIILLGFILVLLMLCLGWLSSQESCIARVGNGIVVAGLGNFVLSIAMVINRLNHVYFLVGTNRRD